MLSLRGVFVTLILAATAAIGIDFVATHPEFWQRLGTSTPADVAGAAGTLLLVMVTNGIVLRELMAHSGLRLQVRAWLGITLVTSLLNTVSPIRGGAVVRAVYLKRVHGVPYGSFASALSATLAFSLAMSGALAAVCLVLLGLPGGSHGWIALTLSVGLVVGLVLALCLTPPLRPGEDAAGAANGRQRWSGPRWLIRVLRTKHALQLAEGWQRLRADRVLLTKLVVWSFAGVMLHAAAFVFAFRIAGFEGRWLVAVTSSAFARIGALIAITPAGLGIFEAFGAISAQIAGAEPERALTGVLLVRLFSVAITIVGAAPFLPLMLPHLREESR